MHARSERLQVLINIFVRLHICLTMGDVCSCSRRTAPFAIDANEDGNAAPSAPFAIDANDDDNATPRIVFVRTTTAQPHQWYAAARDQANEINTSDDQSIIDTPQLHPAGMDQHANEISNINYEDLDDESIIDEGNGDMSSVSDDDGIRLRLEAIINEESEDESWDYERYPDLDMHAILYANGNDDSSMQVDSDDESMFNDFIQENGDPGPITGTYYDSTRIRELVLEDGGTMAAAEAYMHRSRNLEFPFSTYDPSTMTLHYLWPGVWAAMT